LLEPAAPEDRYQLDWFDLHDWYNDGYVAGWSSREIDVVFFGYTYDLDDAGVRVNLPWFVRGRVRLWHTWLTKGEPDFGLTLRLFQNDKWGIDAEPSFADGRLGFVVKTPWGLMAKVRLDNLDFFLEGVGRGFVFSTIFAGTEPPSGPLASVAEHVAARAGRRWLIGGGNPIAGAIVEALWKRVFRGVLGEVFGDVFDGPNTPGLTVAKQTLRDNGGITPVTRAEWKAAKRAKKEEEKRRLEVASHADIELVLDPAIFVEEGETYRCPLDLPTSTNMI